MKTRVKSINHNGVTYYPGDRILIERNGRTLEATIRGFSPPKLNHFVERVILIGGGWCYLDEIKGKP